MDYNDKLAGLDQEYFTNKAQIYLVSMLLSRLKRKDLQILSVGCGDGNELKVLNRYGKVDILDINTDAISLVPKEAYKEVFIQDICRFKSQKKYDVVVCFDVLEHIKEDYLAVKSISDSLIEKGHLFFTVPAHQKLFSAHDKALKHCRRYSKKQLRLLLKDDFNIKYMSYRYFTLFFPVMISKIMNKNSKPKIEAPKLPKLINKIMVGVMRTEIKAMQYGISLPMGISIVGICQKKS